MATTKTADALHGTATKELPPNFTYPFKRVASVERIDDGLACIATMTGQSLDTIKNMAYELGLPKFGPAWVYQDTLTAIAAKFGLVVSEWKEASSIAALPDVAVLSVDVTKYEYGRLVVFTHFRGTETYPSFSAICDPGDWLSPQHHLTTEWKHLRMSKPIWYLEVTSKPQASGKTK